MSHAADTMGDFGVKPILPDNQIDKAIGYFDLLVTPSQEQTIGVTISNSADNARRFDLSINPAVTSDGGTIDYGQEKPRLDETLPFDVRDVLLLSEKEIEVPAKSSVDVPIQVKVPASSFAGRVLAGIHVSPKTDDPDTADKKEGTQIKNRIAYNLAVVLQESRDAVEPDLKLLSEDVSAVNAKPAVQLLFQNPAPTIISKLVFTSKISYEGQPYIDNTSNEFLVAPNSNFHLNLDLAGDKAKAGEYQADISAKSGDGHEWHFTQKFTIAKEKAEEVNKNSVFAVEEKAFPWMNVVLITLALILIVFLVIFWLHRKKKKEDTLK